MRGERAGTQAVKLEVFLPDGESDGLRKVTRSNWDGEGIAFPRLSYPRVRTRGDLVNPGVYVLRGPDDTFGSRIYVGESENVIARLDQHLRTKDFWSEAVFFHSRTEGLNRAHIRYIEARLVSLAHEAGRSICENTLAPKAPRLNELEASVADGFLSNMLMIYPLLGCHAFEVARPDQERTSPQFPSSPQSPTLFLRFRGCDAQGAQTSEGFVVFKGSIATVDEQPSFTPRTYGQLRSRLIQEGVLVRDRDRLYFTRDYVFSSQSAAFSVTTGQEQSGKAHWRDSEGRSLKQIEESLISEG